MNVKYNTYFMKKATTHNITQIFFRFIISVVLMILASKWIVTYNINNVFDIIYIFIICLCIGITLGNANVAPIIITSLRKEVLNSYNKIEKLENIIGEERKEYSKTLERINYVNENIEKILRG
jgi:hypothetical protein